MNTTTTVELDIDLKTSDLYWFYVAWTFFGFSRLVGFLALFLILALAFQSNLQFLAEFRLSTWPQWIACLLLYFQFGRPYRLTRAFLKKYAKEPGLTHYAFSDRGIEVKRAYSEARFTWAGIERVAETERLIVLYFSSYSMAVLPKRCFSGPDQLQQLRVLIRSQVSKNVRLRS